MDITQRIGIDDVKRLAHEMPVEELFAMMRSDDPTTSRNAAWVMTHKSDSQIAQLPQDQLIDIILATPLVALRRLCLNLVERQPIDPDEMRADFLDFCLEHMVSLDEPSGVQALCMKLAHRMCSFYPELQHEFQETLRLVHTEHYKPGLTHLIKKLKTTPNPLI